MFENKFNWSEKLLVKKFPKNVSKHFRMFWIFESFQNVSRFWIIACLFGKHFRVLCKNVYQNVSTKYLPNTLECLRTIHNVLDNCQKCSEKKFWTLKNLHEEFVGKHFRMFHWNFLKCSWTFKKFSNKFVNISKCRVKKYLRTIHNVLDNS